MVYLLNRHGLSAGRHDLSAGRHDLSVAKGAFKIDVRG